MEISYSLNLPRDERSVPVVRRLCGSTMAELGVSLPCIEDVVLALSEACANVVEHSSDDSPEYDVVINLDDATCTIQVTDRGRGFDHERSVPADMAAERGRGIQLMRAVVDRVSFESEEGRGTVVHLEKSLDFDTDSSIRNLLQHCEPSLEALS